MNQSAHNLIINIPLTFSARYDLDGRISEIIVPTNQMSLA